MTLKVLSTYRVKVPNFLLVGKALAATGRKVYMGDNVKISNLFIGDKGVKEIDLVSFSEKVNSFDLVKKLEDYGYMLCDFSTHCQLNIDYPNLADSNPNVIQFANSDKSICYSIFDNLGFEPVVDIGLDSGHWDSDCLFPCVRIPLCH